MAEPDLMWGKADKPAPARSPVWAMSGGLHLQPNRQAAQQPIIDIPLPAELVFSLIDYHRRPLTPRVRVGEHVRAGQVLARGVLASSSGRITAIEPRPHIHPSGLPATAVVLATDGKDERIEREPLPDAATCNDAADTNGDWRDLLATAGLHGLGGAGFDTLHKLAGCADDALPLLIINAAECEPGMACDTALIAEQTDQVLAGVQALMQLTRCDDCIIAVEDDNALAIEHLTRTLATQPSPPRLVRLPAVYPSGAERTLIRLLSGQRLPGGLPTSAAGVLCFNTATAYAVFEAMQGRPMLSRIVTLAGSTMHHPCNVRVRLGTSVAELLQHSGNHQQLGADRLRAGGPLSGFDLNEDPALLPVNATTNAIMREPVSPRPPQRPCIRCGDCAEVCPENLLPQQLYWHAHADSPAASRTSPHAISPADSPADSQVHSMIDSRAELQGASPAALTASSLAQLQRFALADCLECGCCDVVCPSDLPLTDTFRYARAQLREQQRKSAEATRLAARHAQRAQRLEEQANRQERSRQQLSGTGQAPSAAMSDAIARARARRQNKRPG